ncbi:hypothetical protein HGM15179_006975 [Zosterops borbonicus]|uniref:Uncharacterized protein n=1 Tax=Zosterops borbonicus TaxID=364589 RepID=A0A8K1LMV3_9PASS|nr:hypothetical protein HGM15179_006975 [Zosterops borbonicus]
MMARGGTGKTGVREEVFACGYKILNFLIPMGQVWFTSYVSKRFGSIFSKNSDAEYGTEARLQWELEKEMTTTEVETKRQET